MPNKVKKTRKSKGKQHPVHAQSLINIAEKIGESPYLSPALLAHIIQNEAKRVQGILR